MKYPNKKRNYPFKRNFNRKLRRIAFMVVAAILATGVNYYNNHKKNTSDQSTTELTGEKLKPGTDQHLYKITESDQLLVINKIRAAKDQTDAQFWTKLNGTIIKILKDDLKGSRHQKFLIKIAPDISLLVSHNIDLAQRVPVNKGDAISLRGRYEWNHRGGLIHWTHHDPKGKKQGGWIQFDGKIYR